MSVFSPQAFADSQQKGIEFEQKGDVSYNSLDSLGRLGLELVNAKTIEI